jgi:hypothetical protein
MRIVVVFPAPFGPRNPRISPLFTVKEMWSTAVLSPNVFVKFCTSINASLPRAHNKPRHLKQLEENNSYSVARTHFRTFIYTKLRVRKKNVPAKERQGSG